MQAQAVMTRTDAFLFAVKKVLEKRRAYVDSGDVKSLQLTFSMHANGSINVVVDMRAEDVVRDCYDGYGRMDRYDFSK